MMFRMLLLNYCDDNVAAVLEYCCGGADAGAGGADADGVRVGSGGDSGGGVKMRKLANGSAGAVPSCARTVVHSRCSPVTGPHHNG